MASTMVSVRIARLRWRTQDGDDLTIPNLAGFKIFHGTAPGAYGAPVTISDPAVREFQMVLGPGTHYFALAPADSAGGVGALSNEVSKTIE